jgi:hypothetical protein
VNNSVVHQATIDCSPIRSIVRGTKNTAVSACKNIHAISANGRECGKSINRSSREAGIDLGPARAIDGRPIYSTPKDADQQVSRVHLVVRQDALHVSTEPGPDPARTVVNRKKDAIAISSCIQIVSSCIVWPNGKAIDMAARQTIDCSPRYAAIR